MRFNLDASADQLTGSPPLSTPCFSRLASTLGLDAGRYSDGIRRRNILPKYWEQQEPWHDEAGHGILLLDGLTLSTQQRGKATPKYRGENDAGILFRGMR